MKAARLTIGWYRADKHWAESRQRELKAIEKVTKYKQRLMKAEKERQVVIETAANANLDHQLTELKLDDYTKFFERTTSATPVVPGDQSQSRGGER